MARQEIVESRLRGTFTKAVFVEHYADVSQFVYDVRGSIAETTSYVRQDRRAQSVLLPILNEVVAPSDPERFDKAQAALSTRLKNILLEVADRVGRRARTRLAGEPLALALWLLNEDGTQITPWVTTDRVHRDPRLLFPVDTVPDSRWLAVRAVCEGKLLVDADQHDDSRWTYIAAAPLLVDDGHSGRTCIGALTITTRSPIGETWLHRLSPAHKRALSTGLNDEVSRWITSVHST